MASGRQFSDTEGFESKATPSPKGPKPGPEKEEPTPSHWRAACEWSAADLEPVANEGRCMGLGPLKKSPVKKETAQHFGFFRAVLEVVLLRFVVVVAKRDDTNRQTQWMKGTCSSVRSTV